MSGLHAAGRGPLALCLLQPLFEQGVEFSGSAGRELDDIVFDVVVSTVENLPRARRRDVDAVAESVRRAVRAALNEQWGKKPICLVHVLEV